MIRYLPPKGTAGLARSPGDDVVPLAPGEYDAQHADVQSFFHGISFFDLEGGTILHPSHVARIRSLNFSAR